MIIMIMIIKNSNDNSTVCTRVYVGAKGVKRNGGNNLLLFLEERKKIEKIFHDYV